ncbi:nucleotidyltransferase domain-containing protein [Paenibacillus kobensis]|uniref:nucleotidyltransferase domain-containing protein n=1 Tax=Paenibacillus kobensis TaxID=59841 RepID=UPI000FD96DDD|nr:nucleotidyltransferase domain-containing protein [Paenibacillus kobensis]
MLPLTVEETMQALCLALRLNGSNLVSVYLYGSVALGDYIEGSSDIDFIAVLKEAPSATGVQSIAAAHEQVANQFPQIDIMGSYVLESDLYQPDSHIQALLTYYDKQLHTDGCGSDLNPVTWWIVKHHGIRVYGPVLPLNVEADMRTVVEYVIQNLNTYWAGWVDRLEHQLASGNMTDHTDATAQLDEAVEWCTLGMLRQLYTIQAHDIKSKIEAGHYGITIIPPRWHELIYEAIHIKRRQPERYYHSNEQRLTDLVALLRYIQLEANRAYEAFPS